MNFRKIAIREFPSLQFRLPFVSCIFNGMPWKKFVMSFSLFSLACQ